LFRVVEIVGYDGWAADTKLSRDVVCCDILAVIVDDSIDLGTSG